MNVEKYCGCIHIKSTHGLGSAWCSLSSANKAALLYFSAIKSEARAVHIAKWRVWNISHVTRSVGQVISVGQWATTLGPQQSIHAHSGEHGSSSSVSDQPTVQRNIYICHHSTVAQWFWYPDVLKHNIKLFSFAHRHDWFENTQLLLFTTVVTFFLSKTTYSTCSIVSKVKRRKICVCIS